MPRLHLLGLFLLLSCLTLPAQGISVSHAGGGGGVSYSDTLSCELDRSASLQQETRMGPALEQSLVVSGEGENTLDKTVTSGIRGVMSEVSSSGQLKVDASTYVDGDGVRYSQMAAGKDVSLFLCGHSGVNYGGTGSGVAAGYLSSNIDVVAGEDVCIDHSVGMQGREGHLEHDTLCQSAGRIAGDFHFHSNRVEPMTARTMGRSSSQGSELCGEVSVSGLLCFCDSIKNPAGSTSPHLIGVDLYVSHPP